MSSHNNNSNRTNNKHLFYLNELSDYKVASDDPDVRGWKVKDSDNRVIGKVDNLLVNKNTERVVYLDVEVDSSIIEANHDPYGQPADSDVHEFINKEGENHIIIPVGLVRIMDKDNDGDKHVYTDRINHRTFAETKRIERGANVSRDYEVVVLNSYNRDKNDNFRNTGTTGVSGNTDTGRRDNDSLRDSGTGRVGNDTTITNASTRTGDKDLGRSSTDNRSGSDNYTTSADRRGSDNSGRDSGRIVTDESGRDSGRRVNDDLGRDSGSRDSDFDRDSNRVNTNTDSSLSGAENDRRNYDSLGNVNRNRNNEDDDSFYERKEFDRSNYRRNNNS